MIEQRTIAEVKPNRIIRWPEVQDRVGLSRSHIHALQHRGLFPMQIKLVPGGRASGLWSQRSRSIFKSGLKHRACSSLKSQTSFQNPWQRVFSRASGSRSSKSKGSVMGAVRFAD